MQKRRAAATRSALVAAGRALFSSEGYHATGTGQLVTRAGVTSGALYHHFADKEGLFEAVFLDVAADLDRRARQAVTGLDGDLLGKMKAAFRAYLGLVASCDEFQRILLIDGPAVLGWRRCRELQARFVIPDTQSSLRELMVLGQVTEGPAEQLAYLIQAALNDAALTIANASSGDDAAVDAVQAFVLLLDGLAVR